MNVSHYKVELTVQGLVHIGCGETIGKKDYFFDGEEIIVIDPVRFISKLNEEKLMTYCSFMQGSDKAPKDLNAFLIKNGLKEAARNSEAYRIKKTPGMQPNMEVRAFIKDSDGEPYVPGSSLKGAFRTALLAELVESRGRTFKDMIPQGDRWRKDIHADREIIKKAFLKKRPDPSNKGAASDIMRFISVSDSTPLDATNLVFAKKFDKYCRTDPNKKSDKIGNELNIYRECLRPGTIISFNLSIDDRIETHLPFSIQDDGLIATMNRFNKRYEELFLNKFENNQSEGESKGVAQSDDRCHYACASRSSSDTIFRNSIANRTDSCNLYQAGEKVLESAVCYIGGGVGFSSKTIANSLFADDERLIEISKTLFEQFPTKIDSRYENREHKELVQHIKKSGFNPKKKNYPKRSKQTKEDHRHWMDKKLGVSPHTLKMGIVGEKLYPMGKCKIEITPVNGQ